MACTWSSLHCIEVQCFCSPSEKHLGEISVTNRDDNERSCVDWRALQSSEWQTRRDAVTMLGLCGSDADGRVEPEVMSALCAAFKDEDWRVRRQSIFAFRELGEAAVQEALPDLRKACMDPDACVRMAASLVLQMYGNDAPSTHDEDASSARRQLVRIVMLGETDEHDARLESVPKNGLTQDDGTRSKLEDAALLSRLQEPALSRATDDTWHSCEGESNTGFSPGAKTGTQSTEEGIGSRADTEGNWSCLETETSWLTPREKSQGRSDGDDVMTPRRDFRMSLVMQSSRKLGITLELGRRNSLKVASVEEEGSINEWNQTQSPESQLQAGDRITSVNGVRGDYKRLLKAMESTREVLEVIFVKKRIRPEETELPLEDMMWINDRENNLKVSSIAPRSEAMQTVMQRPILTQTSVWPRTQSKMQAFACGRLQRL